MPCACGGWGSSSGGQTRSDVAAQKIPRRDETRHVGSPRPLWPAGDGDNTTPRAPRQRNAGKKIRAAVRRRRCSSVRCDDGCPIITPPLLLLHPRDAKRSAQTNQPAGLGILRLCEHPPRPVSLSLPPPLGAACLASCASCSSPPATATATAARCPKASKPKRPGRLPPPPTTTATTSPPPSPCSQSLRPSATSTSTSRSSRANRDLPDPATPPFSGEIHLREFRGCWRRRGRYRAGCG